MTVAQQKAARRKIKQDDRYRSRSVEVSMAKEMRRRAKEAAESGRKKGNRSGN